MAPSITGYTGTWTHGGSVIINGSSFLTKSVAAPELWDTVDNISAYAGVSDGSDIPVGSSYPFKDYNDGPVTMERTDTMRSVRSTAMYKVSGQKGLLWGRPITSSGKLYCAWWWKHDANMSENYGLHSTKFFRASEHANYINHTMSWTVRQWYIWDDPDYLGMAYYDYPDALTNRWNLHEVLLDSTNGSMELRVNCDQAAYVEFSPPGWSFDWLWAIGYDGNNEYTPSITGYMDDIYLDNSFARVFLGNASTYANCTALEMQIPTAWASDGQSITVTVNQGALETSAYPYVVDANGSVSAAGTQITFGESEPDPPTGTPVLSVR